jgi:hypothetical protein
VPNSLPDRKISDVDMEYECSAVERARSMSGFDRAASVDLRSDPRKSRLMKSSHTSWRWLMIALAFFATPFNYLDRQTLSVAAPVPIDQFRMTNTAYAQVISAFMLAYTIANGISGPVIDRLGTRLPINRSTKGWDRGT